MLLKFSKPEKKDKKWEILEDDQNQEHLRKLVAMFNASSWDEASNYLKQNKVDLQDRIRYSRAELKDKKWRDKSTLLHILAYFKLANYVPGSQETANYNELIVQIIKLGADINAVGDGDYTVIMSAISEDNHLLFDALLKQDDINLTYYSQVNEPGEACALAIALSQNNDHYLQNLSEREDVEIDFRTVRFAIASKNPNAEALFTNYHLISKTKITKLEAEVSTLKSKALEIASQLEEEAPAEEVHSSSNKP